MPATSGAEVLRRHPARTLSSRGKRLPRTLQAIHRPPCLAAVLRQLSGADELEHSPCSIRAPMSAQRSSHVTAHALSTGVASVVSTPSSCSNTACTQKTVASASRLRVRDKGTGAGARLGSRRRVESWRVPSVTQKRHSARPFCPGLHPPLADYRYRPSSVVSYSSYQRPAGAAPSP
jgi:hypothetical protein